MLWCRRRAVCVLWMGGLFGCTMTPAFGERCADLMKFQLPGGIMTRAERVAGDESGGGAAAFCRVALTLTPSSDSEIQVEVWMPETGWNGRMEGTGNGGFAGSMNYRALKDGLARGYATVNTDMGMATPPGGDASVFVGRPERWRDWGYRSTHEMTRAGKQIIQQYYGRAAERAYFVGCSTGGEQGLMEAQRFPEDYDGIVAGAPANNRTGVHTSILWDFVAARRVPGAWLGEPQLSLLSGAVLAACDKLDGVEDGVVADPPACRFDAKVLACRSGNDGHCLSSEQVETVRRVYAGPVDARTGRSLYPGVPRGSEAGWSGFGPPPGAEQVPPFAPIFRWVSGPDWDWRRFNFGSDYVQMRAKLGGSLNALNPDLSAFEKLGHKLIVYHGWADSLVPPGESIYYFDAVAETEKEHGRDAKATGEFYQLFMVPGMEHCGGGAGADQFDALGSMAEWVERGRRPDSMLATGRRKDTGAHGFERVLCAYPLRARYDGKGDTDRATSFRCGK